jgi:uncharacterized protein YpbB
MLTVKQRALLVEGFGLGLQDKIIAERIGISFTQVYSFRKSQKISGRDLLENRLNTWMDLIRNGMSIESIAKIYILKPASIRQMLWREKIFSFRQAKDAKLAKQMQEVYTLRATGKKARSSTSSADQGQVSGKPA